VWIFSELDAEKPSGTGESQAPSSAGSVLDIWMARSANIASTKPGPEPGSRVVNLSVSRAGLKLLGQLAASMAKDFKPRLSAESPKKLNPAQLPKELSRVEQTPAATGIVTQNQPLAGESPGGDENELFDIEIEFSQALCSHLEQLEKNRPPPVRINLLFLLLNEALMS